MLFAKAHVGWEVKGTGDVERKVEAQIFICLIEALKICIKSLETNTAQR